MKRRMVLLAGALVIAAIGHAQAQRVEMVPGAWFASDKKFGIVFEPGDSHPSFLYATCNANDRGQAEMIFEIDPAIFGPMVTRNDYIVLRHARSGGEPVDLIVETIVLNEAGQYGWSLKVLVDEETVRAWMELPRVELVLGARAGTGFKPRHAFVLPDRNRRDALSVVLRDCFSI
jgi:hypothetical protein